jgi:hypothetical protein
VREPAAERHYQGERRTTMKKAWWDTLLINNPLMRKISLALRRGRQLERQTEFAEHACVDDDVPTIPRAKPVTKPR